MTYVILHDDSEERLECAEEILNRIQEIAAQHSARIGIPYGVDVLKDNGKLDGDPTTAERTT